MDLDILIEELTNEINFLQKEVDRYKEQNKRLVKFILKLRKKI